MKRFVTSHHRLSTWMLVAAVAAALAVGVAHTVTATSSPIHASQYWLRISCITCGGCNEPGSAFFPSVGGQTVSVRQDKCAAGPDTKKGDTIEIKIMKNGQAVLSGRVVIDDQGETGRRTLGSHDGLTYSAYCSKGYVACGGGAAKDTWFVDVEATCN